jgi:hypothetical protein
MSHTKEEILGLVQAVPLADTHEHLLNENWLESESLQSIVEQLFIGNAQQLFPKLLT